MRQFYINDEVDYNEWNADLGNKFETDVATTFFEKFQFININGAFKNLLGQHEMNGVVKLNNDYLLTTIGYVDDEILLDYTRSILYFKKYLDNRGTKLLYAITPYTLGKYDNQLPVGIEDYGNDNADRLLQMLSDVDVATMDFRALMHEDGIDHYKMMYKTDHHWTTEAGFYAYGKLEQYIVNETGCEVDKRISDISNYSIKTYKNWHLGTRGQRTGKYYAGIDDFDLILPNFNVNIQSDDGKIGSMQDMVINLDSLKERKVTSRYTYDRVLGGDIGHYVNLEAKNDIKILIISDSFAKAVNPYLMMGFAEINYVDDSGTSEISPEYIENYDPDIVILLYYLQNAMSNRAYSFSDF